MFGGKSTPFFLLLMYAAGPASGCSHPVTIGKHLFHSVYRSYHGYCYLGIKEFSFNLFSEPTLPTTPSYQTTTKTSSNQTKITTLKEISSMTTPKPHTGMTTPKRNSVMTTQTNQATMTTSKGETLTFT